jgi:tRNA A-37 threonylcarbamoyl transferase component Bud32/tetratricopeptide (TPR) repeat protein
MSVERIGRYEIEETLGKGAMGVVYLARDPIIDRRVALKTLRVDLDAEMAEEFRERFVREARAAGRLNHPGIVTVHDVGEDPETGLMYIAMEYVEGRDLKQMLQSGHSFRPSEAARIAADVAVALDYAHSLGVVHRDIKPANIVLTNDGSAKITDFGIAHLETSNLTVDGQFIGTPNFMSPEQITGNQVDGRSDIFSLGVVLFTLLTGQRPFGGDTMHEVTLRIVQEPSPIPSKLRDDIPAALNPIVLKCLEKNPDRRFQSGSELAQVLAALASSMVQRDSEDAGSTGVYKPDLETRIQAPATAAGESGFAAWKRQLQDRLEVPEWLRWDVQPRWIWIVITGSILVVLVIILGLRLQIDHGPFPGPSVASTRNLHAAVSSLHAARDGLREGRLDAAEEAVRAALDQAPTSPAGRRLAYDIHRAIEEERTSAANQERVSALVSEGRQLYRNGSYSAASSSFREALELDPKNEIAASYLELADERLRAGRERRSSAPDSRPDRSTSVTDQPVASTPVPGIARITLSFDSPLSSGSISVTLDGESLAEVPFDFSRSGILGLKRKGRGTVKRVILTPSGRHVVGVQLIDDEGEPLGSASFENTLESDTRWTLRVDLPDSSSEPNFFLVKASR